MWYFFKKVFSILNIYTCMWYGFNNLYLFMASLVLFNLFFYRCLHVACVVLYN